MTVVQKKRQWQGGITALAILTVVLLIVLCLLRGAEDPAQASTGETQLATEPTLPPPEANPYGPTDFQYDGRYLTCIAGASRLGIDVSAYQGEIDWQILSKNNIFFAYIKATEGSSFVDKNFAYNFSEAQKTDLHVGAYHFFSYDSSGEIQAQNFIENVIPFDGILRQKDSLQSAKKNPPHFPLIKICLIRIC